MRALVAALRWDARALSRSPAAWLAIAVLVLASGLAVISGVHARGRWADEAAHQRASELGARRDHVAKLLQGDRSAALPILLETSIGLPPAPLAELTVARSDLDPRTAAVSVFASQAALFRDYQTASPFALAIGRFDLGFVVVVLLPLIIIALGYGLLSEERERNLDRLLAVHGVPPWRLALGRVALRSSLVAAPTVAALAALFVAGEPGADRALRCALAALAILGYAAFWWSIVLVVASIRLREGTTLLALLVAWVALVLIVPATIGAVAKTTHPAPSRFALIAASRAAEIAAVQRTEALLGGYAHDHPDMDPKAAAALPAWARRSFLAAREVDRAVESSMAAFDHALVAQRAIVARAQVLSPALLAHRTLAAIAGTDETRALAFRDQARRFLRDWRATYSRLGLSGATVDPAMIAALPTFALEEPPVDDAVALSIALLWGLAALGTLVALRRLR